MVMEQDRSAKGREVVAGSGAVCRGRPNRTRPRMRVRIKEQARDSVAVEAWAADVVAALGKVVDVVPEVDDEGSSKHKRNHFGQCR